MTTRNRLTTMLLAAWSVLISIHCAAARQAPLKIPGTPDHLRHAEALMEKYPLIDTHVDTPQVMRILGEKPLEMIQPMREGLPGHFDIKRARQGRLGGAFFTVWTPCADQIGEDLGPEFQNADNTVRDTIESIDLIRETIDQIPELEYAETAKQAEEAFTKGKIAALIGMEGSHMLGNSLSTIRILARLGVRYLTLTHVCHSSFASSAGGGAGTDGTFAAAVHKGNGLQPLGRELVRELNRLGVMVDLSHVSDQTMHDVLDMTDVPVAFTHSGARAVHDHPRNVPDDVLDRMGPGKNEGIIQSVLYPVFIDPLNATIPRVADHVEYIASRTSRKHVGLASDFDGMGAVVEGMEDVSKWPYLIAEFIRRGWSDEEIGDLMGGNLLRVMRKVEDAKVQRSSHTASTAVYHKRSDLPANAWGGPNGAYLPPDVKKIVDRRMVHDEL